MNLNIGLQNIDVHLEVKTRQQLPKCLPYFILILLNNWSYLTPFFYQRDSYSVCIIFLDGV